MATKKTNTKTNTKTKFIKDTKTKNLLPEWENSPSEQTPLNEINLNRVNQGILQNAQSIAAIGLNGYALIVNDGTSTINPTPTRMKFPKVEYSHTGFPDFVEVKTSSHPTSPDSVEIKKLTKLLARMASSLIWDGVNPTETYIITINMFRSSDGYMFDKDSLTFVSPTNKPPEFKSYMTREITFKAGNVNAALVDTSSVNLDIDNYYFETDRDNTSANINVDQIVIDFSLNGGWF